MAKIRIVIAFSSMSLLAGCLSLGTQIGVGSGGITGGVVVSGNTEIANGVTVGTSLGKAF